VAVEVRPSKGEPQEVGVLDILMDHQELLVQEIVAEMLDMQLAVEEGVEHTRKILAVKEDMVVQE
jgi:hypothetical protein